MQNPIIPIHRETLSNNLARRLKQYITQNKFQAGDRLPTTAELASQFGVGQPTIREAIKKLETVGVVSVKHGSGMFVGEQVYSLFLPNPIAIGEPPTKKLLLDLIDARTPIEMQAILSAATNASQKNIEHMESFLEQAKENLENDEVLNEVNMAFHKEIALASGNYVLYQIIEVLSNLFREEQRLLIGIYMVMKDDHEQHVKMLTLIKNKDGEQAALMMQKHLSGVRDAILRWDPEKVTF